MVRVEPISAVGQTSMSTAEPPPPPGGPQPEKRPWWKKTRYLLPLGLLLGVLLVPLAGPGGEDGPDGPSTPNSEAAAVGDDELSASLSEDVEVEEAPTTEPPVADEPEPTEEPEPTGEPEPTQEPVAAAELGEPARDGRFEFTVNSLDCGATSVGEEPITEEAQGQFCLLDVRVENIGDRAQSLFADNQLLIGADGTQYSASGSATLANDLEGQSLFAEINPGNAVEGTIVFDVPPDAEIAEAELHDSAFSGGVSVDLSD